MVAFNYTAFREEVASGKVHVAMQYYKRFYTYDNASSTLRERVQIIGNLERDFNLLGASINVRCGARLSLG